MKVINKKGWTKIAFGEVCKNLNLSEHDPLSNGIDKYIGLEHIETGNLHINRFGDVAEGTTFTKKFLSGHVLFGKRRAYLKKAAVANFDGICSGDILVFEANEKVINKNLFPFLVSSDRFFDYAVQTSAGSLSPRTKFQDLAKFEFLLPPLNQQAKLAELLWAGDEVLECQLKLLSKILIVVSTREKEIFDFDYNGYNTIPLEKAAWFQEGPGLRNWQFTNNGIKVINVTNLKDGILDLESTDRYIDWNEYSSKYKHFECDEGDIVVASSGNSYCKHAVVRKQDLPLLMNTSVIRFKVLKGTCYEYLNLFLKSKNFKTQIDRLIEGGAQPNFGPYHLKRILIPFPNEADQKKLANTLDKIEIEKRKIEFIVSRTKQIQKQLINQIF